jgi:cerevisin
MVGKKYGVAKKARVFAIKISEPDSHGRGRLSDGLKGIEWAVNAHAKNVSRAMNDPKKRKKFKGSVMNISFASDRSPAFNAALNAAVDTGMHVAVAAGNDNYDACKRSPASAQKPISVGASNFTDDLAWFSNYGPCVDIFAPGMDILSAWIGSNNATRHTSGTSIASPHVAGLLAYLLSLQPDPDSQYAMEELTPKKLKDRLLSLATRDVLSGLPLDTKNVRRRRLSVIKVDLKVLIAATQILAWNGAGKSNLTALQFD